MNYTTKNNLTKKFYFVRMFVILNLISFISFQLILAPCIYAEDISKVADTLADSGNFSPLILATNNSQYMKEIEELEQKEKEIKKREIQTQKYKRMVLTGKIMQWSAYGIGLGALILAATMQPECADDSPKNQCNVEDLEKAKKEKESSIFVGVGGVALGFLSFYLGAYLAERGRNGLAVSYKNNELANEYYVTYQYNF